MTTLKDYLSDLIDESVKIAEQTKTQKEFEDEKEILLDSYLKIIIERIIGIN